MTFDVRSLAYAPGVSVFPACSGFTPGWVYVRVDGGAACLISLIYWALVMLEFVVCSTALVQGDTKKWELLKNPTKIEEIQQKKFIDRN